MIDRDSVVPRLDLQTDRSGVTVAVPILPETLDEAGKIETQRRLLDELLASTGTGSTIFWYYTPMALAFSGHLRPDLCVYDCMDELSAFRFAPPVLTLLERELMKRADLVFTGGLSLFEAKCGLHESVHAFPSSIDKAHFAQARGGALPEPADQLALSRPRLGFFGVIDERIDLDLVAGIADRRRDWQLVMLGPVVKIDPSSLPKRANIHWLGGKRYDELPAYLAHWDVGLMPFARNEATRFISPTKTPEFLAAGLPVVSTAITDVIRPYGENGLVEIADDAAEMVVKADRLLRKRDFGWLDRVDAFLQRTSWDKTWAAMNSLMHEKLAARAAGAAQSMIASSRAGADHGQVHV